MARICRLVRLANNGIAFKVACSPEHYPEVAQQIRDRIPQGALIEERKAGRTTTWYVDQRYLGALRELFFNFDTEMEKLDAQTTLVL